LGAFLDLTGERFDSLIVLERVGQKSNCETLWKCRCDCGAEVIFGVGKLRNGTRVRCPECSDKHRSIANSKYEDPETKRSKLYCVWAGMKGRCSGREGGSSAKKHRKDYYDRGIRVCPEWEDFNNFRKDMGESFEESVKINGEKYTTLDRIDNNKGYCKENCHWTTFKGQSRNRRSNKMITHAGVRYSTLVEFCEIMNFDYGKFSNRYNFMMNELMEEFQYEKSIEEKKMVEGNNAD